MAQQNIANFLAADSVVMTQRGHVAQKATNGLTEMTVILHQARAT